MIRALCFHCCHLSSIPGLGAKIPEDAQYAKKYIYIYNFHVFYVDK